MDLGSARQVPSQIPEDFHENIRRPEVRELYVASFFGLSYTVFQTM